MVHWVNRLRNNIFVNPPPLPLSCEISGALHLVQPGRDVQYTDFIIDTVITLLINHYNYNHA